MISANDIDENNESMEAEIESSESLPPSVVNSPSSPSERPKYARHIDNILASRIAGMVLFN